MPAPLQPITALSRWIDTLGPGAFTLLALGLLIVFAFASAVGITVFIFSNWPVKRERNLGFVHSNRWYELIYGHARTKGGTLILVYLLVVGLLLGVLSFGSVVSLFVDNSRFYFVGDWTKGVRGRRIEGLITLLIFALGGGFTVAATALGLWRCRRTHLICAQVHEIEAANAAQR